VEKEESVMVAQNQAQQERERAKRLARKIEELRSRISELKQDKARLEVYCEETDAKLLYADLKACLQEYRTLKGYFDEVVSVVKETLEKTTGEIDILVYNSANQQEELDFER